MFKENYLGRWRELKNYEESGDHVEVVTHVAKSVLAPSEKLIGAYRRVRRGQGGFQNEVVADWWDSEYAPEYLEKIGNSLLARQRISWLQWKEHELRKDDKSVWIVSYEGPKALQETRHSHRFILLDILEGRIKL